MKRPACLVVALVAALPFVRANAADYTVQQPASTLGFSSTFQGERFEGHFEKWNATIRYDAADLAASKFEVSVDLASVRTGDKDRDGALPGTDFFDVSKYPQAHFVTRGFRRAGTQVVADGELTLRGVTKPVSLTVSFAATGKGASLEVAGTLHRLDFGVGGGAYADTSVIGADVGIKAHLLLVAK